MAKKQKNQMPINMVRQSHEQLVTALDKDPKYSLKVDPGNILGLSPEEKKFIECYIEFRSIPYASQLAGISEEEGRKIYFDPICKQERQRINRIMYYRSFSRGLLTVDEVGGYLTSLLMDEDIGGGNCLTTKDKLQVTKQIIDINKLKADAYNNPRIIEDVKFTESEMQDLSPEDLKNLIEQTKKGKNHDAEKSDLINQLNKNCTFDSVDLEYLWSCSIDELKQLLKEKEERDNAN